MQLRSIDGWALLLAGLVWLAFGFGDGGGPLRLLAASAVGTLATGAGVAALLLPGDRRIPAYGALASVAGGLVAVTAPRSLVAILLEALSLRADPLRGRHGALRADCRQRAEVRAAGPGTRLERPQTLPARPVDRRVPSRSRRRRFVVPQGSLA